MSGLKCYCNIGPCVSPRGNMTCIARKDTPCYTHIEKEHSGTDDEIHHYQYGCLGDQAGTTFQVDF